MRLCVELAPFLSQAASKGDRERRFLLLPHRQWDVAPEQYLFEHPNLSCLFLPDSGRGYEGPRDGALSPVGWTPIRELAREIIKKPGMAPSG